MIQDFKSNSEEFRGQRWLTTLLLLTFAAAMVAVGIKGLASGEFTTADKPSGVSGFVPARLAIPGQNFEVTLAQLTPNQYSQPGGVGWLKTSSRPGEAGTAVIAVSRDWPVAKLQPGDRLELTGQSGQKLAYEITGATASVVSVGPGAAGSELKLVTVEPGGRSIGSESLVITARPVATN